MSGRESERRSFRVRYHKRIEHLFGGYGAFASRHPGMLLAFGVLLCLVLSMGLFVVEKETDLADLWIERGTRVVDEKAFFEKHFGGLTRKQQIGIVDRVDGNIAQERHLNAMRAALQPLLSEGTVNEVKLTSTIGGAERTYTQKDFCQTPPVPAYFKGGATTAKQAVDAGTTTAWGIQQLSACLPGVSVPLPARWGIDRFPCTRATVLDCFAEGNFDYPQNLQLIDNIAATFRANLPPPTFSPTASLGACLVAVNNTLKLTEMSPGNLVSDSEAATMTSNIVRNLVAIVWTWGYSWRRPYTGQTQTNLTEFIKTAAQRIRTPQFNIISDCILSDQKCCVAWNGLQVDEHLILGAFGTKDVSNATSMFGGTRTVINNVNENDPEWITKIGVTGDSDREALHLAWEKKIQALWEPMWDQEPATGFGPGETYTQSAVNFITWRSLDDTLDDGSSSEDDLILAGVILMVFYACFSLAKIAYPCTAANAMYSRVALGFWGVCVVVASTAASFGFYAAIGEKVNPISINLVPFLSLGLGVDDMFVMAHTLQSFDNEKMVLMRMKKTMGHAGPSVLLTSMTNAIAFFVASVMPIPAVETFVIQMGITAILNFVFLFLLFVPAMVYDARRTKHHGVDLCCPCVPIEGQLPTEQLNNARKKGAYIKRCSTNLVGPCLTNVWGKVATLIVGLGFFVGMAVVAFSFDETGLRLSDVALKGTFVRDYVDLQENDFSGYDNFLISTTSNFADSTYQAGLIRAMDDLQNSSEWMAQSLKIVDRAWYTDNTRSLTYAAYSTRTQTPLPNTSFYPAFQAWATTLGTVFADQMSCRDKTTQTRVSCSEFSEASHELIASSMFVPNRDLLEQKDFLEAIEDARERVDRNQEGPEGTWTFVYGFIYQFWQQYLNIRINLYKILGYALLGVLGTTILLQLSPLTSLSVVATIIKIVVELYGVSVLAGVKLNAFSLVNLVMAVGMAVEFTAHIANAFLFHTGSRNQRMQKSLTDLFAPMLNGAVSTFLALIPLAFARYPFFRLYYFTMFTLMVVIAFVNGMIFLPVLLSIIGPRSVNAYRELKDTTDVDVEMSDRN